MFKASWQLQKNLMGKQKRRSLAFVSSYELIVVATIGLASIFTVHRPRPLWDEISPQTMSLPNIGLLVLLCYGQPMPEKSRDYTLINTSLSINQNNASRSIIDGIKVHSTCYPRQYHNEPHMESLRLTYSSTLPHPAPNIESFMQIYFLKCSTTWKRSSAASAPRIPNTRERSTISDLYSSTTIPRPRGTPSTSRVPKRKERKKGLLI